MQEYNTNEARQAGRANFMAPQFQDSLKKREEFSISLRKKKKEEIIQSKRKRLLQYRHQ